MAQPISAFGHLGQGARPTVGAYLDQWLDHARGRVRAKTYDGYEALIRLYASPGLGSNRVLRPK